MPQAGRKEGEMFWAGLLIGFLVGLCGITLLILWWGRDIRFGPWK